MNLPAFANRYRAIVITMVTLLMAWGVMSYISMPRREDPEYTVRTCAVMTRWSGAPTEKVEELITSKLEEALDSIDEVDIVRSTSTVGFSEIYVDAEDNVGPKQIDNVWDKVRARVARVEMPESGIVPQINDDYGDTNVLLLAVYQTPLPGQQTIDETNRYTPRQLDVISDSVKDAIRLLPGVSKVEQAGVLNEAIYIETDMGTWSKLKLTTSDLKNLLDARNIVASGGSMDTDVGRFSVKPGGEFNAVREIQSIVVAKEQQSGVSAPVTLKDLDLKITRDYEDPPRLICRFSDAHTTEPCVIVAVSMKSGSNIIDVCVAAKARVKQMQEVEQILPPDISVVPVSDQSENVTAKIDQVVGNVIGAVLIVVVVVFLVVGMRTAMVMAVNIPVVVLASLALMPLFGVELEQISLASIIIALGLLVDNAVQVCDQSRTNQINGMRPVEATISGANQLSVPMLIGTATTVAAFLPMLIGLSGSKKEYVYSLPVTLSITLGISWVLAMTFCTLLSSAFIRSPKDPSRPTATLPWLVAFIQRRFSRKRSAGSPQESGDDFIAKVFRMVAGTAIKAKFLTVGVSFGLLFLVLMLPVGSEFFPKDLRDQFVVEVWLPESVSISQTDKAARQVEQILQKLSPGVDAKGNRVERIRAIRTMVGGGGARWYLGWNPQAQKPNYAEILVRTSDGSFTSDLARDVRKIARDGDPELGIEPIIGARVIPQELMLGPSADPIALRVTGTGFADKKTLRDIAEKLKQIVRAQDGTWDVYDTWGVPGYQLHIDVDEDKANLAGVTNAHVAQTLNAYFSGHRLTTFREGDHLVPVSLRLVPEERASIEGLQSAFVEGVHGKVPLDSIATIGLRWDPARIERRDLDRVIEVRGRVEQGVRGNDVVNRVMGSEALRQLRSEMPAGYRIEVGGSMEESAESMEQMGLCLGISMITIVLLLVIQYNGWAKPVIILATLPLALIGAFAGLYFTGNPLGFMSQLGILALFGIVLNTGIIFIEFADLLIEQEAKKQNGSGPIAGLTYEQFRACLVQAGQQRLLPIFLTTATTIGGLLPLAIAGGPLWEGMAWCMICGLMVATLLTLLVVPALYAIFAEYFGMKPFRVEEVNG